jgi:pimeloyl-ACP methyl ester carboxylesterase
MTVTTFLLIHGAYQGGFIWKPVAERLRAAGHTAFAPSLDGCGERAGGLRPGITTETQADELAKFLWSEDLNDVVVAGTSAGGMVMCALAERARDRIARIVFADALALLHGERIRDIVTRPAAITTDIGTGPTRDDVYTKMTGEDVDPETAAWAADRFGLHPIACFEQPVVLNSFWDQKWDADVVYCPQALNPGEAHQRRCAEKLGARWHMIDTGHYPSLSTPDALTKVLVGG